MTSSAEHAPRAHGRSVRRPIKVASLATQVATLIEEECIASGLEAGDKLPSEGELAIEFGVSRVVVREAMKTVEARGLVHRHQGKRAVVAEPNARPIEDYVTRSASMDKRNVLELTEVRKALEVHGARLAAVQVGVDREASAELINQAQALIGEMYRCPPNAAERAALDIAFHHVLAEMSGNVILAQMLGALDRPLHTSREQHHQASIDAGAPRDRWAEEHQAVLDAIASGDTPRAVSVMEDHLDLSIHEVELRPEGPVRPVPPAAVAMEQAETPGGRH